MSQQFNMNPSFNLSYVDEAGYQGRASQYQDAFFPDWNFPGARTSINSVPSPTATVRSAPAPVPATRIGRQQSSKNVQYHNVDPNLYNARFLAPPGAQSVPVFQNHAESIADPLTRFYQEDEPWNAMKYSNTSVVRDAFNQPQRHFRQYRQGPASDVGSNAHVSDSGYQTQPSQSVLSQDPNHVDQELPSELMAQTKTMNVHSTPSDSHEMQRMPSDQRSISQYSSRSGRPRQPIVCQEPGCDATSNNNSEHKKHMLKHVKPFVCKEKRCKRGGKGFSTSNDLDRHKKSVHGIGVANSKSYKCAADGCQNKLKVWPRLDNFKQHIDRMHKVDDQFILIKQSEVILQDPQRPAHSEAVVDPSHLLAGMDSQSALTTMDANGNALAASMQGYMYPEHMSLLGAQFHSGPSQVSPSTQISDMSFSQAELASFELSDSGSMAKINVPQLGPAKIGRIPARRHLSHVSSAGKVAKPAAGRGLQLNVDTELGQRLSSAPQTKSEQQKQKLDLDKLSKAKLQEMLRQLLETQQQSDDGTGVVSTAANQRHPRSPRSPERSATQTSASSVQQKCPFEDCNFTGRTCDLNKHLKRHAKPYGCTYPKCFKKFGAKSDWKRHENSQHFQQETFRCDLSNAGKTCGLHYYRAAQFQTHIEHEHKSVRAGQIQGTIERCKIGRNCQGQYWCGFCGEIKKLNTRRNFAWDERFDHIAHHFERDNPKKHIGDWICVEENRTKRELKQEMEDGQSDKNAEAEGCDGDVLAVDPEPLSNDADTGPSSYSPGPSGSRKRQLSPDAIHAQPPPKRRVLVRYCCECGDGPWTDMHFGCPGCYHDFCTKCELEYPIGLD